MDDTHATTGSGAESGEPDHDDGGEGRCARSRRRGLKTSHIVLLGAAIALGTALLVTGLSAADGRVHAEGYRPHARGHRHCRSLQPGLMSDRTATNTG